jgi:hypothetical protein
MSAPISLRETERKMFRAATNDGLTDVLLGCFFLMFVIAPHLSEYLGDFWSSAVFLPFYGLVWLLIRWARAQLVKPRLGSAEFGPTRKARLRSFTTIMLILNLLAFALGIFAFLNFAEMPETTYPIVLGVMLLVGFTLGGYFLDVPRFYGYGLMTALAPLIGEMLWEEGLASHHGYPIAFGTVSAIMILTGLFIFVRLLRQYPSPSEAI